MLVALLPLLAACTGDDSPIAPAMQGDIPIGFEAAMPATRATANLVDQNEFDAVGSEFLVFADYRFNTDNTSPTGYRDSISIFRNVAVRSQGAGKTWEYSPLQFWQQVGAYDFRAVWPSSADVLRTSNGQALGVSYSIFSDNIDLMVAYKRRIMPINDGNTVVGLDFRHALSAVRVYLVNSEDGQPIQVENIFFRNLYAVGVLVFTGRENDDAGDTSVPTYTQEDNLLTNQWRLVYKDDVSELHNIEKNKEYLVVADALVKSDDDFVFMLPQEVNVPHNNVAIADEDMAKVCFNISVGGQTLYNEVNLPEYKWEAGKKYTYLLTVRPGEKTNVTVITTEWDPVTATADDIVINAE